MCWSKNVPSVISCFMPSIIINTAIMTLLISCYQIFVVVSFELFLFIFCVCVCQERTIAKKNFSSWQHHYLSFKHTCDVWHCVCGVCRVPSHGKRSACSPFTNRFGRNSKYRFLREWFYATTKMYSETSMKSEISAEEMTKLILRLRTERYFSLYICILKQISFHECQRINLT